MVISKNGTKKTLDRLMVISKDGTKEPQEKLPGILFCVCGQENDGTKW